MEEVICNNRVCADCNQTDPQKMNVDLETIICSKCAVFHKKILNSTCYVKDVSSVDILDVSNFKSNQYYEDSIPAFIRKPDINSPHILREQWIYAKYERKEFTTDKFSQIWYQNFENKKGWLWKKEKEGYGQVFRQRYFVLDRSSFSYYLRHDDAKPKLTSSIDDVSVYLKPEYIEEPNSMQIVIKKDGNRRSLFIFSDFSEDIYNWYMAIRSVKWTIFKCLNQYLKQTDLYKMVPHGYLKQGWLYKTGNKRSDRVLKRWFCLENDNLIYSSDPLNPYPKGEIHFLLCGLCDIKVSYENEIIIAEDTFCFSLKMPHRTYYFASTHLHERKEWIEQIVFAIDQLSKEIVQKF